MKLLKRETQSSRPIRVMQFGGGNFLRAYIDWMMDILNNETDFNGDVLLIKPTAKGNYDTLKEQDGLYHVLTKGTKDDTLIDKNHLVECIQEIIHPYHEWELYIQSAQNPSIRFIVSNTTESGIRFSTADAADDKPATEYPAKLTQWLWARYKHFQGDIQKGCLFLPCELIENNGQILRDTILQYAEHWKLDSGFSDWIHTACHFANTLVDRIVTGFPSEIQEDFLIVNGCQDKLAVEAEPYHLLVIEGPSIFKDELAFNQTNVNAVFTENLDSYREIKVRILNGAHTAMVPVAYLAGIRTVKEAIDNPELNQFIQELLFDNIIPTLDYPQEDLKSYVKDVIDRFKNPFIKHQLIDISLNSISKFKTRLLPSLLEYKKRTGKLPKHIIKALAALIIFYRGNFNNESIPLKDSAEIINFFGAQWKSCADQEQNENQNQNQNYNQNYYINENVFAMIETILKNVNLWGIDLSAFENLSTEVTQHVLSLLEKQNVS